MISDSNGSQPALHQHKAWDETSYQAGSPQAPKEAAAKKINPTPVYNKGHKPQ